MSEERFKEIKDSIEAQLRIAKAYNYGEDLLEILNEEKDLYDYANELQQELERYKNIIDGLEKWLEKQYQDTENCFMFDKDLKSKYKRDLLLFSMCLDKLKELKGE